MKKNKKKHSHAFVETVNPSTNVILVPLLQSPSRGHRSREAQMPVYKTLTDVGWLQRWHTSANQQASSKSIHNRSRNRKCINILHLTPESCTRQPVATSTTPSSHLSTSERSVCLRGIAVLNEWVSEWMQWFNAAFHSEMSFERYAVFWTRWPS